MTGSDIAKAIQKLNDENQRLRDALRTKERETLEQVLRDLDGHNILRTAHAIVRERIAALTPEGTHDD